MSSERAQETAKRLEALQARVRQLQSRVRLTRERDSIEDVGTRAGSLRERVAQVRSRGYVFEHGLQEHAADLEKRWLPLREQLQQRIQQETAALQRDTRELERMLKQLEAQPGPAGPSLDRAEAAVKALEAKSKAAAESLDGMYDQFEIQVVQLGQHLDDIEWALSQVAEATFGLLPTEAVIAAVPATWQKDREDSPKGVLFLTDQRLLFEQKQEIATKKVLFITTHKEKLQELRLDVPLAHLDKAQATRQGLLGHEDHLDLDFSPPAQPLQAHFHIDGQRSEAWQQMIGRAKSGDYDADRVVPVDLESVERARAAPTRCPACNAPITQSVLRGMDRITCAYCGHVIRL